MNPESHIKGTEMAQGCHFAFSVQDWSQHPSLQEFGHNCISQTRPRLRGQKPGVRSGLVHSLAGGSPFRLLTCRSCCAYILWAEWWGAAVWSLRCVTSARERSPRKPGADVAEARHIKIPDTVLLCEPCLWMDVFRVRVLESHRYGSLLSSPRPRLTQDPLSSSVVCK